MNSGPLPAPQSGRIVRLPVADPPEARTSEDGRRAEFICVGVSTGHSLDRGYLRPDLGFSQSFVKNKPLTLVLV